MCSAWRQALDDTLTELAPSKWPCVGITLSGSAAGIVTSVSNTISLVHKDGAGSAGGIVDKVSDEVRIESCTGRRKHRHSLACTFPAVRCVRLLHTRFHSGVDHLRGLEGLRALRSLRMLHPYVTQVC